jgi:regulator of cell morphogenesis and NO signaling
MSFPESKPVGEVVAEIPAAARVFEKYNIDYVCGGRATVGEVCRSQGLNASQLAEEIALAARMEIPTTARDWNTAPLAEVIRHILVRHHLYLENALPAIDRLLTRIADTNGERFPKLVPPLLKAFHLMKADLLDHLRHEEMVLFPAIIQLEKDSQVPGRAAGTPLGRAGQPLAPLEHDHDEAGRTLAEFRSITGNYTLPPHANHDIRTLYQELRVFEENMNQHLNIENNILFARAKRLVASTSETRES